MTWGKHEDGFHDHRKVIGTSLAALGLLSVCRSWALRHRTDGSLPFATMRAFVLSRGGSEGDAVALTNELVTAGLFDALEAEGGDGYRIHDFLHYNPSKRQLDKQRKDARDRMRNVRKRSPNVHANESGTEANSPEPSNSNSSSESPSASSPEAVNGTKKARTVARAREGRIPEALPEGEREAFAKHAPGYDLEAQFAQFADHHHSRGTVLKDWRAAFRNWLRNALKFEPRNGRSRTHAAEADARDRQAMLVRLAQKPDRETA